MMDTNDVKFSYTVTKQKASATGSSIDELLTTVYQLDVKVAKKLDKLLDSGKLTWDKFRNLVQDIADPELLAALDEAEQLYAELEEQGLAEPGEFDQLLTNAIQLVLTAIKNADDEDSGGGGGRVQTQGGGGNTRDGFQDDGSNFVSGGGTGSNQSDFPMDVMQFLANGGNVFELVRMVLSMMAKLTSESLALKAANIARVRDAADSLKNYQAAVQAMENIAFPVQKLDADGKPIKPEEENTITSLNELMKLTYGKDADPQYKKIYGTQLNPLFEELQKFDSASLDNFLNGDIRSKSFTTLLTDYQDSQNANIKFINPALPLMEPFALDGNKIALPENFGTMLAAQRKALDDANTSATSVNQDTASKVSAQESFLSTFYSLSTSNTETMKNIRFA